MSAESRRFLLICNIILGFYIISLVLLGVPYFFLLYIIGYICGFILAKNDIGGFSFFEIATCLVIIWPLILLSDLDIFLGEKWPRDKFECVYGEDFESDRKFLKNQRIPYIELSKGFAFFKAEHLTLFKIR